MKLHEPYASYYVADQKARLHAQQNGPGNIIETKKIHESELIQQNLTISLPLQTDCIFIKMWDMAHESLNLILDQH